MGSETKLNFLPQAMKKTKVLPHLLLQQEEPAFYVEANAAGVSRHMWEMVLKKSQWGNSKFGNPNTLRLEVQADPFSSRTQEHLDILREALQVSEDLEYQNLRCWQAQTAEKGAARLWMALCKPSDLSETWSFSCKKENNIYLRVLQDMRE